uniref:Glyoxylate/hydroxypyruvate reductase A n=1 Tax=Lygus hesperus TaxID=30085 RepID=A0A0A9Z6S5_LYGHE
MSSRVRSVAIFSDVPRIFSCISKLFPSLQVQEIKPGSPEALQSLLKADVILADFDKIAEHIYFLKETKWIQGTWAGVEPIIKEYDKIKELPPCPIARFSGAHFGSIMSEYVVAHVTSFERDFRRSWGAQKECKWDLNGKIKDYKVIGDMEVGVLGGGQIGSHIAGVLKKLGARIWCLVRSIPTVKSSSIDEYRETNQLDEILEHCDLIINVLPHSPTTAGLLNSRNLGKCKGSLLVNIGRGSLVTESDLIDALEKKYLRGAILDVFPKEPLSPESKLWTMPEVIITPHVAGLTRAEDVAAFFKQNLDLWNSEGRLMNAINFEKGY